MCLHAALCRGRRTNVGTPYLVIILTYHKGPITPRARSSRSHYVPNYLPDVAGASSSFGSSHVNTTLVLRLCQVWAASITFPMRATSRCRHVHPLSTTLIIRSIYYRSHCITLSLRPTDVVDNCWQLLTVNLNLFVRALNDGHMIEKRTEPPPEASYIARDQLNTRDIV